MRGMKRENIREVDLESECSKDGGYLSPAHEKYDASLILIFCVRKMRRCTVSRFATELNILAALSTRVSGRRIKVKNNKNVRATDGALCTCSNSMPCQKMKLGKCQTVQFCGNALQRESRGQGRTTPLQHTKMDASVRIWGTCSLSHFARENKFAEVRSAEGKLR